ncbi:MAG TPA: DUF5060 domain-containing protein [Armatimonadota bacterium]|nr:DUF5060 domain-containing protein [Armatimonadota bacterium]
MSGFIQWRVATLTFTPAAAHEHPLDVAMTAEFTGPGGAVLRVPAFYDGAGWQARVTPTLPGEWRYRTVCAEDAGLDGQRGSFTVRPAEGDNPLYRHGGFLRVSENRGHLAYADGAPFFWLGDTWWFCPSHLMPFDGANRPEIPSMYRALIDRRAAQGFSVVQWAFLGSSGVGGRYADLYTGTFNAAYWAEVDRYVAYANDAGIIPVIGLGFHHGLDIPTLDELWRAWRYVVARYGAYAVGWLICGEYNLASNEGDYTETDLARIERVLALGQRIKDHDPYRRAMTVHPWWHGGDRRQAWTQPWYDFIMLQGGHGKSGPAAEFYRAIYADDPALPLLEAETTYEGIFGFDDAVVRRNAYKAVQSGSFGFTYGAHGLWYPTQSEQDDKFKEWGDPIPWWKAMDLPGAAQLQHLRRCYEMVDWWTLEPRDAAEFVDTPRECFAKANARAAVLYLGAGDGAVTLTGAYHVTLCNPRTGEMRASEGTTPALDEQDWVIVLRN